MRNKLYHVFIGWLARTIVIAGLLGGCHWLAYLIVEKPTIKLQQLEKRVEELEIQFDNDMGLPEKREVK